MIGGYRKEIGTNTQCAIVMGTLKDGRKIKFAVCRYVKNEFAEDKWRPSADSFKKIAENKAYEYFGDTDFVPKRVKRVTKEELEKITGVDWYDFGKCALEQDQWAKLISGGIEQVIADHADKEFENDSMGIDEALDILESEDIKVIKTQEQIEAERARRKERRMARRLQERKENEMMLFKYTIGSSLRYSDELWNYAGRYERELKTWGEQNSKRGRKIEIRTDSDHDDYYIIVFYIKAPRKFKDYLTNYFESKKKDAPWWMDYGISGLRMDRI